MVKILGTALVEIVAVSKASQSGTVKYREIARSVLGLPSTEAVKEYLSKFIV
jgi:hypothetical protein